MVEALVEWAEFIHEHGTEAAIARVDTQRPSARPPRTAPGCSTTRASTPTTPREKIVEIRKTTRDDYIRGQTRNVTTTNVGAVGVRVVPGGR